MSSQGVSIALVSLGCSKNLVDAENMLGLLAAEGHQIVEDPEQADVIIVNTCAFIQPAEEEAIDALLDMSDLKKGKRSRVVICTGCLPSRRGNKLVELLPEVDAFVGVGSVGRLPEVVRRALAGEKVVIGEDFTYSPTAQTPRWRSAPQWSTYLRIADGCSNFCSFCTIPDIRGPYRSRPVDDIVDEFQNMVSEEVREVCLIAQDTTVYGTDLPDRRSLPQLLQAMGEVPYAGWIRLLYMHPEHVTAKLVEAIAALPQVVHYVDLPLQHVSKNVLYRMGRRGDKQQCLDLIRMIRSILPDAAIRTTFMTGFPQETEGDFEALLEFVQEARLDRVSAFRFWPEEGTPAATMVNQIPEDVGDDRLARLMELQEMISLDVNRQQEGQILQVLVEEYVAPVWKGRSYRDAPEVDGEVKIVGLGPQSLTPGSFVLVKITRAEVHDLEGTLIG